MTDAQAALAQVREALATGPTPGEWRYIVDDGDRKLTAEVSGSFMCDTAYYPWCPDNEGDWKLIAACSPPNIAAILAHVETQKAENEQLREMLARLYAGSDLYCDDGELQDARTEPFIDFKRDSVADIRCAMVERNERKKQRWSQQ